MYRIIKNTFDRDDPSLLESSIEAMVSDRIWNQYIAYKTLTNDSNMNLLGHLIKNNQENLSIMEINIYE